MQFEVKVVYDSLQKSDSRNKIHPVELQTFKPVHMIFPGPCWLRHYMEASLLCGESQLQF